MTGSNYFKWLNSKKRHLIYWQLITSHLSLAVILLQHCCAQSDYTRSRGAIGIEAFSVTPRGAVIAEAAFGYRKKSFWNIQAGLGAINKRSFRSPTLSTALSYCLILNPYKRNPCNPHPGYNLIDMFLEAGLGGFYVDRYDNNLPSNSSGQRLFTPSGLFGVRINLVSDKLIYSIKPRYTPSLMSNPFASIAGLGLSLGWR